MCGHYTQVSRTLTVWFSRVVRTSHINKNIAVTKHFYKKTTNNNNKCSILYIYINVHPFVCVCLCYRWCGQKHTEWAVRSISAVPCRVWTGTELPFSSVTTIQRQCFYCYSHSYEQPLQILTLHSTSQYIWDPISIFRIFCRVLSLPLKEQHCPRVDDSRYYSGITTTPHLLTRRHNNFVLIYACLCASP